MIELKKHSTAWYKAKTAELNRKRVNILIIESYYCQKNSGMKLKTGMLLFRHVEPFITIANDLRYLQHELF